MNIEIIGLEEIKEEARNNIDKVIRQVLSKAMLDDYFINICLVDEASMIDLYQQFKHEKKSY